MSLDSAKTRLHYVLRFPSHLDLTMELTNVNNKRIFVPPTGLTFSCRMPP